MKLKKNYYTIPKHLRIGLRAGIEASGWCAHAHF